MIIRLEKISFPQYLDDMTERMPISIERFKINYENVTQKIFDDFTQCDFCVSINKRLKELDARYFQEHEFKLISGDSMIIKIKKFKNMLDKCYRIDVVNNKQYNYDDPEWRSSYEWQNYENIYVNLKDIIRTRIIIRYLDGIKRVQNELQELSTLFGLDPIIEVKADETGYYGIHYNFLLPFDVPDIGTSIKQINCSIEIQLTTQIKSVVNDLLHLKYREERLKLNGHTDDWQWDYNSTDFVVNYLGHILHYTEGMIMDARQKMYDKSE